MYQVLVKYIGRLKSNPVSNKPKKIFAVVKNGEIKGYTFSQVLTGAFVCEHGCAFPG